MARQKSEEKRRQKKRRKNSKAHARNTPIARPSKQPKTTQVADPNNLDTFQYDVQQKYNR
jgi:hypothetical protein